MKFGIFTLSTQSNVQILIFLPTDFITSLLPGMPPNIWIGLHFEIRTRENRWTDGSELVYSNFHPLLHGRLRKIEHDVSHWRVFSLL